VKDKKDDDDDMTKRVATQRERGRVYIYTYVYICCSGLLFFVVLFFFHFCLFSSVFVVQRLSVVAAVISAGRPSASGASNPVAVLTALPLGLDPKAVLIRIGWQRSQQFNDVVDPLMEVVTTIVATCRPSGGVVSNTMPTTTTLIVGPYPTAELVNRERCLWPLSDAIVAKIAAATFGNRTRLIALIFFVCNLHMSLLLLVHFIPRNSLPKL